ncbi:MAG: phage shock protein operon transcriptional activator [Rhodospirillales bacterium]|nr:phage shock protein operon transcriptional activator [Rhodospirillales bacterium]
MADSASDLPPLIGESTAFLEMMEAVSLAAPLNRPALVIGERGTGKELIAARLHYLSARWGRPLIKVNCAALPETLLETELFGHEAGAFTGAVRRRMGRFERADEGTLFLDEIANASQAVQEKILRVVEYGEMERVGGSEAVRVDVRVIAATNVDLPGEAAAGRFRHDLLDRLAFEVLTIPPLRHRPDDIPLLAGYFARAMAMELGWDAFPGFTPAASAALAAYSWPGNVREIKNVAERAVYRWPDDTQPIDEIQFDPFASPYRPVTAPPEDKPVEPAQSPTLRDAISRFEIGLLKDALEANRFNQRATARHLGLSYDQLRNRLRKYGIIDAGNQKSRSV